MKKIKVAIIGGFIIFTLAIQAKAISTVAILDRPTANQTTVAILDASTVPMLDRRGSFLDFWEWLFGASYEDY